MRSFEQWSWNKSAKPSPCTRCRKSDAVRGMKTCRRCLDIRKESRRRRAQRQVPTEGSKVCKDCGATRHVTEFYRNNQGGRRAECRDCFNAKNNAKRDRSKHKWSTWRDRKRNPDKARARSRFKRAVADGKIKRPPACERCGSTEKPPHGHHEDYSKPFDVMWLCVACHADRHREIDGREK